jgi:hypothetical protein
LEVVQYPLKNQATTHLFVAMSMQDVIHPAVVLLLHHAVREQMSAGYEALFTLKDQLFSEVLQ